MREHIAQLPHCLVVAERLCVSSSKCPRQWLMVRVDQEVPGGRCGNRYHRAPQSEGLRCDARGEVPRRPVGFGPWTANRVCSRRGYDQRAQPCSDASTKIVASGDGISVRRACGRFATATESHCTSSFLTITLCRVFICPCPTLSLRGKQRTSSGWRDGCEICQGKYRKHIR